MAELAKSGVPSLSTTLPCPAHSISGLLAGEAIAAGDACYIATTGLVMRSTGAAATAPAKVRGFAAKAASINEAVTLYHDVNFYYGAAMTPGTPYFLSGTVAGGLADAASTGGTAPVAYAVDATRLRVLESRY